MHPIDKAIKDSVSKFRPDPGKMTEGDAATYDQIYTLAEQLDAAFRMLPQGRYTALATTALEESISWAEKARPRPGVTEILRQPRDE